MRATLPLAFPAAIPVGHRIEVTWYLKPSGIRRKTLAPERGEPFVVDLDSGIRYGAHWQLGEFTTFRADRPHAYSLTPLPELQAERLLRARVTACTIVHVSLSEPYEHTVLELDEVVTHEPD